MPYFDRWMRVRMEHPRGITLLAEDTSTGQHMGAHCWFHLSKVNQKLDLLNCEYPDQLLVLTFLCSLEIM